MDQSSVNSDCNSLCVYTQETGDHETQESEGGEADLCKHFVRCKKNPGHKQFIPIDTFTLKHLPEGHQDNDLYEYIKVIADQTVRVNVKMKSPHRPKFWTDSFQHYPFYNMRNIRNLRTGSGRVLYVNKYQDKVRKDGDIPCSDYKKCWCRNCEDSDSPSNIWWEFYVHTATHVVFDEIEAEHVTIRLFYNRDDSPAFSFDKVNVVNANIACDLCWLKCVTCDKTLGEKMMKIWKNYKIVWKNVATKYKKSRDIHKLTFIVSHPHGCSKQVSFGQWKDKLKVGARTKFTYTTSTCPGSSGAYVQCVGYNDVWGRFGFVHSGSKAGLNYSCAGRV
ncbi:hypothetical protein BgiMline_022202 [Biomphalaria glabrata]|uniref:Uncharacterized protein LOC106074390 isoform X3 n=1 Tax=Biomphalaria glabrata TaxID=6526 RepID=A0A9U8EKD5_BIOGL|nr:uncharacterized protein LOC106074390 isoform X3 [Biomphalaria glabrata]XP_013090609.2 uncharacterized protein LOC106074390 isoform X3 [Biomphalaria glabrata]XP_013090610.2 uncharacterized protein LOC106074390 isoform X3 [Biomphalaria glabrata]XP_055893499.1 uncharacterized protein LOC106074390 isoform X3 [Biomphalaria glabrata]KAI8756569.1 hypothetical protein BgiMline_010084 [Biomphalaria glabrata]